MNSERQQPVALKLPTTRGKSRSYPWWGLFLGILAGVLVVHPLAMLVQHIHDAVYDHTPLALLMALSHSFSWHMWPMILLYAMLSGSLGAVLGRIFQRLTQQRQLLELVHHEFELQVATLRHHYKNLAIGIRGFSHRIRRKLEELDLHLAQCSQKDCPLSGPLGDDLVTLEHNAAILDDAAQRLTATLGQELLFLKALTSDDLPQEDKDIYPVLRTSVQDLLGWRFRDKILRVEINGRPWDEGQDSLTFSFEPCAMEVILHNLLSNAMKYGDHLHIRVADTPHCVRVEIKDNGPGTKVERLKQQLADSGEQREQDSTRLGLKVSLHLLEKSGGHLWVATQPGAGATFIAEFPRLLPGGR
jgi:signal transduction histidine kinase